MQVSLKRIGQSPDIMATLEWDQDKGTFASEDKALLADIEAVAKFGLRDGRLPTPFHNFSYPIKNPFHEQLELAVVLAMLDLYSDDLPLPLPAPLDTDVEVVY